MAERDTNAFLHAEGEVQKDEAFAHPVLGPFLRLLKSPISVLRRNDVVDSGWVLASGPHLAEDDPISFRRDGDWCVRMIHVEQGLQKGVRLSTLLDSRLVAVNPPAIAAHVPGVLKSLEDGLYAEDSRLALLALEERAFAVAAIEPTKAFEDSLVGSDLDSALAVLDKTIACLEAQGRHEIVLTLRMLCEADRGKSFEVATAEDIKAFRLLHAALQLRLSDAACLPLLRRYPGVARLQDRSRNSLLHIAVSCCASASCIDALLAAESAAAVATDKQGRTPLAIAKDELARIEILESMMAAFPEAVPSDKKSPASDRTANRQSHLVAIIETLRRAGGV